ncbi:hypothetical protein SNOG_03827 [Parastagonospora nodorum SN15]|uniref:Uncharacterized protein n=1 Tax=Phaeosphaeria nodorum (strain SN15 / ATCC MYA-4574 / FGSC 10173) TaxID=321614 RepID=Q0UWN7_PHANO|nr:hypothetical protein SNOG_03827 [Parastagonospora nodorum SN15]EAT89032.1 hypothetical protein SNOG_03827 [Parastagonospora nodorum SN15]
MSVEHEMLAKSRMADWSGITISYELLLLQYGWGV